MNTPHLPLKSFMLTIVGIVLSCSDMRGAVIFDSYSGPNTQGGFSSPNSGAAIQVSVATDVEISGISILNEMFTPGNLRFALYSHPQHALLLLTEPVSFTIDGLGIPTWKDSAPIAFALNAGRQYLVGYVRDVGVNDVGDTIAESSGGITSDLVTHCLSGYQTPSYSHACITGIDFGVRLQSVPEPSVFALLASSFAILTNRRRNDSLRSPASKRQAINRVQ